MNEADYSMMGEAGHRISVPNAKARLFHEPTGVHIDCRKPINFFQCLMLRWCFGLKYIKL